MHDKYDTTFYPFYAVLTAKEKKIYQSIFEKMQIAEERILLTIPAEYEEVKHVLYAIYNDRPELFWYEGSASMRHVKMGPQIMMHVFPDYNCYHSNLSKNKSRFNEIITMYTRLAQGRPPHMQEMYIHDSLTSSALYKHHPGDQSAYAALVERKAVCSGFARAFQLLMQKLDIPCYYCTGQALPTGKNEWNSHAWNIIKFENDYYNLDITWDGPFDMSPDQMPNYRYYNCTDSKILLNHKRSPASSLLPECKGTKYSFEHIKGYSAELQMIYDTGVTYTTPVKTESEFFHVLCMELERRKSDKLSLSFPVYGESVKDNALEWTKNVLRRVLPYSNCDIKCLTTAYDAEWCRIDLTINIE